MKQLEARLLSATIAFFSMLTLAPDCMAAKKLDSLVPKTTNTSPDYFCTWNIQGYYSSYADNSAQKDAIRESRLFGHGPNENWLGQYTKVRGDLYFLMDEGWDMPGEDVMVIPGRFPSYAGENQQENFK